MKNKSVCSLSELADLSQQLVQDGFCWFRGVERSKWTLKPKVFRVKNWSHAIEIETHNDFRRWAPSVREICPGKDDWGEWSVLFQHYGGPTRLLDWTESSLVAAFFALWKKEWDTEPATIYALNPRMLNRITKQADKDIIHMVNGEEIRGAAGHSYCPGNKGTENGEIIAFHVPYSDDRFYLQRSVFTVHNDHRTITEIPELTDCVRKVIVPAKEKAILRRELEAVGFDIRSVFHDMPSIGNYLGSAYGQRSGGYLDG